MTSILLFLLSCLVAVINTIPPYIHTTMPGGCVHRGKFYLVGEHFSPTPCEKCFCGTPGQAACLVIDCAVAMCVDAVKQPDQCCPACPNGMNCKHGDVIIKMGEVYQPDKATSCQCNFNIPMDHGLLELKPNCTSV